MDITQAHALIEGMAPGMVIADKSYDANHFVAVVEAKGAQPVILPRSNRLTPRAYHRHWYKDRNLVERFFNRIKTFPSHCDALRETGQELFGYDHPVLYNDFA